MKKLEIIIRHSRVSAVRDALLAVGVTGMSMSDVKGFGRQGGHTEVYRGSEVAVDFVPKVKIEVVLRAEQVNAAIRAAQSAARTGTIGDGKIFVLPVERAVRIRTGDADQEAL